MTDRDIDDSETAEDFEPASTDENWTEEEDLEEEEGEDFVADEADGEADGETEVAATTTGDDEDEEDDSEALDELEAEELEMLTDDEESETLIVDEAAELRAIRRAELAMEGDGVGERSADEFLCQGCFLVLKRSQLVDATRSLCRDCAV